MRLRATAVLVVVVCLFATLFGRLWYLQGVEANTLAVKSVAGQGIETVYVPAPRGEIFDRNGALLAGNKLEQVVTVAPGAETAHPGIVEELSALLGRARLESKSRHQQRPVQPVPIRAGGRRGQQRRRARHRRKPVPSARRERPGRARPLLPAGGDDGQHRRLCQRDHRPGVHAEQGRPVRAGRPVLPGELAGRPSRRGTVFRELPPRHAGGGKGARSTPRATCSGRSATRPRSRATTSSFRSRWPTSRLPCRPWTIGC